MNFTQSNFGKLQKFVKELPKPRDRNIFLILYNNSAVSKTTYKNWYKNGPISQMPFRNLTRTTKISDINKVFTISEIHLRFILE